jgi:isopentenyl diphosphate isomerase/L-lactate dehydrogenase-like FMN-dependent dehydrogenase
MRHNREAFERWRIVPRMLHGITERDLSTSIVGTRCHHRYFWHPSARRRS